MKRVSLAVLAAGGFGVLAAGAVAQSLGGFPIREPGSGASHTPGAGAAKPKGLQQIVVDANGNGPYKTISKALENIAEGGTIYVMHGDYNESLKLTKSVFIQGDRGPGDGVSITVPARQFVVHGERRDFMLIRPIEDPEAVHRMRRAILAAYEAEAKAPDQNVTH